MVETTKARGPASGMGFIGTGGLAEGRYSKGKRKKRCNCGAGRGLPRESGNYLLLCAAAPAPNSISAVEPPNSMEATRSVLPSTTESTAV